MNTVELSTVKDYQKDFQEKYGKKLYIDWLSMKGVDIVDLKSSHAEIDGPPMSFPSLNDLLNYCTEKYGADVNIIKDRTKRIHFGSRMNKEKAALIEYSKIVIKNRLNARKAAEVVNRDRTVIYHFAKMEKAHEE